MQRMTCWCSHIMIFCSHQWRDVHYFGRKSYLWQSSKLFVQQPKELYLKIALIIAQMRCYMRVKVTYYILLKPTVRHWCWVENYNCTIMCFLKVSTSMTFAENYLWKKLTIRSFWIFILTIVIFKLFFSLVSYLQ